MYFYLSDAFEIDGDEQSDIFLSEQDFYDCRMYMIKVGK